MVAEAVFVTGLYESYCTVEDVMRLLAGYDLSALGDQAELVAHVRELLPGAKAAVDAEAGRDFLFHVDEEVTCDGSGSDRLSLASVGVRPIGTVHGVVVAGRGIDEDEYAVYGAEGVIRLQPTCSLGGSFPRGIRNVTVSLDWGYETAPGEIALAQARLVSAQLLAELAGDKGSVQSVHLGDYSVSYSAGGEHATVIGRWLEDAARAARSYRPLRMVTAG